jgi:hypothetical protein
MSELHVAAQRLTLQLANRMEPLLAMRGIAARTYVKHAVDPAHVELVTVSFDLPGGEGGAVLLPRDRAEPGDECWVVDVKRTDGLCRDSWSGGIVIQPREPKKRGSSYALWLNDSVAGDRALQGLIDELARPLKDATRLSIFKLWKLRFTAMPPSIVGALERTPDDNLDQLEAALLSAPSEAAAIEATTEAASS